MDLGLVTELPVEQLDLQPFGIIRLDRSGTVLTFNSYEERLAKKSRGDVIGRNFFQEIAPCTKVKDFHGRFLDAVAARSMNVTFGFVFPFAHGTRYVDVSIYYKEVDDTVWVIVRGG
jgi:photoactive yellow protein